MPAESAESIFGICKGVETPATAASFLQRFLLLLPHGSSGTSTPTEFRSPLYLLSGLERWGLRLPCCAIALSCLHRIHEILLELLGYSVIRVKVVFRLICFRLVVYLDLDMSA